MRLYCNKYVRHFSLYSSGPLSRFSVISLSLRHKILLILCCFQELRILINSMKTNSRVSFITSIFCGKSTSKLSFSLSLSQNSSVCNPPHMYTFSLLYRAQKSNTIRASGYQLGQQALILESATPQGIGAPVGASDSGMRACCIIRAPWIALKYKTS